MNITLALMILELLVCTGSFICSILQFKLRKYKRKQNNRKSSRNNKSPKDKKHKD